MPPIISLKCVNDLKYPFNKKSIFPIILWSFFGKCRYRFWTLYLHLSLYFMHSYSPFSISLISGQNIGGEGKIKRHLNFKCESPSRNDDSQEEYAQLI